MRRSLSLLLGSLLLTVGLLVGAQPSWAYPFWAQQNYDSPREATGKIVCANCHLAKKLTQVEVPQSVMPDTVFKAVVKVPYDTDVQQVGADGNRTALNVGAVVMLPDGYTLAPQDRLSDELKEETEGIYYTQYSDDQPNILLVGPLPGDEHQELVFPILAPDPKTDSLSATARPRSTWAATAAAARCTPPVKRATTPSTPPAWLATSLPSLMAMPVPLL